MNDECGVSVRYKPQEPPPGVRYETGSVFIMNDEEQLEHVVTPPTPDEAAALAADKAKYGALKEAELEAHDEKARQVFKAQIPELMEAKKREYADDDDAGDPLAGSDAAKELIRDAIRQGK
jgi:hypothetical protein